MQCVKYFAGDIAGGPVDLPTIRTLRIMAVALLAVPLMACFEVVGVTGPTVVTIGDIVEYEVSFRAVEGSSSQWFGRVWYMVPNGWVFLSGEYSGVIGGAAVAGELTPDPPQPLCSGCFQVACELPHYEFVGSASAEYLPPADAGDSITATLRFRVGGTASLGSRLRFGGWVEEEHRAGCHDSPDGTLQVEIRDAPPDTFVRGFVPQGGTGPGAAGATFDTSVVLFNPDNAAREFTLSMWGVDGGGLVFAAGTLPAAGLREILVSEATNGWPFPYRFGMFQADFSSAHRGADPMMQAVIAATIPDGRQFGQFFQGGPSGSSLEAGEKALLFTTHDPDRYRVNVGVSALSDQSHVVLTPLGDGGEPLAAPVSVIKSFKGSAEQINDIYTRWNLGDATDVMVEARVESGSMLVYGSILDGRGSVSGTSDPTTMEPVKEGSNRVVLLELGRITGLNEFSGSASVHNHSPDPVDVRVDFHERGVPGVSGSESLTIGGEETISWDDAVGDLMGRTEVVGALVFNVEESHAGGPGISAVGREFAIYRSGNELSGTAGQAMPGLTDEDVLMPGEVFHFLGLRERELDLGPERSHLGLLNLGSTDSIVTISGFAADGSPEGSADVNVLPGELRRINRVLNLIQPDQDGGLKRIEVTATAPVFALAYRVNANGDPVTLQPIRR